MSGLGWLIIPRPFSLNQFHLFPALSHAHALSRARVGATSSFVTHTCLTVRICFFISVLKSKDLHASTCVSFSFANARGEEEEEQEQEEYHRDEESKKVKGRIL